MRRSPLAFSSTTPPARPSGTPRARRALACGLAALLMPLATAGVTGCADEADERPATTTAFTSIASTASTTSAGATDSDGNETSAGGSGTTTSDSTTSSAGTSSTGTDASTGTTADPTAGTGTTGTTCAPGDGFACVCPDGSAGLSVCTPDGAGFGPCECSSDTDDTTGETTGGEPASEVCFLGDDRSGTTCIPVRALDAAMFGYPTAPADPNYRAPLGFLDLQGQAGTLKLAPNFALSEFADPDALRDAILQPHAVERLQAIRDAVGPVVVEVAFRTPTEDQAAGAPPGSRHPYGDGFELRAPNTTLTALAQACTANSGTAATTATTVICDFRTVPVDPALFGDP